MSRGWYYKSGDWNAICDRCGQKHKASKLKKEWTGFMVCAPCYETRHPMDFLKTRNEKISVAWSRPISDMPVEREEGGQVNSQAFNTITLN